MLATIDPTSALVGAALTLAVTFVATVVLLAIGELLHRRDRRRLSARRRARAGHVHLRVVREDEAA